MRVGRAGIEQNQDEKLRGTAGSVEMEVNAVGRVISELNREEGVPGEEISLTIDRGLQQRVLNHIGDQTASAVVMDCHNGEVLAMVSTPSFDPSLFDSGVSHAQWIEWTNNQHTPLINKAVAGVYPPGSTFKPAVAMAALESGLVSPTDRVFCPGHLDVGGTRFHCWSRWGMARSTCIWPSNTPATSIFTKSPAALAWTALPRPRTAWALACRWILNCPTPAPG